MPRSAASSGATTPTAARWNCEAMVMPASAAVTRSAADFSARGAALQKMLDRAEQSAAQGGISLTV